MPDRHRERFYLACLQQCRPDLPPAATRSTDPPDSLLGSAPRIGVELTQFHLPPRPGERPHQEVQSLHQEVMRLAERLHSDAGGPPLYVTAGFRESARVTKRTKHAVAHELSNTLLRIDVPQHFADPTREVGWRDLPRAFSFITVHASVDGVDRLWYARNSGWVAPISPDHVQAVISRKERVARAARTRCDELWLVIVNDSFSGAAPAQLAPTVLGAEYRHPFDRVLCLEPHVPRAYELAAPAV